MNLLKKYVSFADLINEKLGRSVSWLTSILVLLVCYDVFSRYLLKESFVAIQELEWHIFALIFLLGAAYTLKEERHVRVDIIYARLPENRKALINLLGCILFLLPFCVIVIYSSKDFVLNAFNMGESSPDPGGLPARYILKSILPISFFFLLLQGISLLFKSIITLRDHGKN